MEGNTKNITAQDVGAALKVIDYMRDDLAERVGDAAPAYADIFDSLELTRSYIDIKAHGTFLDQARAGVDELLKELEEKAKKAKQ